MKIWITKRLRRIVLAQAIFATVLPGLAQVAWQKRGTFIAPGDLPVEFAASLHRMGGRLASAEMATVSMSGTLTDSSGARTVQITAQAPGYLRFQDTSTARVLTYDGTTWKNKNGKGGQDDARIEESLLAHLPDSFLLQLANGGGVRRIGTRFRTDDGKTPNYSGPYWTLYEYSPSIRPGLTMGQPLQQSYFVAIDEATWLISEIRTVIGASTSSRQVIQTKFNSWFQRGTQWYPGEIVRLENGKQILKLTVQQGATTAQLATSSFEP